MKGRKALVKQSSRSDHVFHRSKMLSPTLLWFWGAFLLIALCTISVPAIAGELVRLSGPQATLGKISSTQTVLSIRSNPAAASILVTEPDQMRFAYMSSIGIGAEVGAVDNFEEEVNDLIDELERDDIGVSEGQDILDRFNTILPELGSNGYIEFNADLSFPFGPFVWGQEQLQGAIFVDLSMAVSGFSIFLDDPIAFVTQSDNSTTGEISTNSALYLKTASVIKLSVGYSRMVLEPQWGGRLHLGSTLNLYNVKLSKSVLSLEGLEGQEVSDVISDEYDKNQKTSGGFGIDVGALWLFDDWQAGFVIENINEPEFRYGSLPQNCAALTNAFDNENCNVANFIFSDEVNLDEKARLSSQARIEGSYFLMERQLEIGSFFDLNEAYDLLAIQSQLIGLSANYLPLNRWVPDMRLGLNKNISGSKLTKLALGATFLKVVNFDIAYSLDDTTVDGDTLPRSFLFNLGFEHNF